MPDLVSVIIPNYNDRDNLALCIGSLMRQDYVPLEIIVVDDGSTDGSADMVRGRFPQVRLIARKQNMGFSSVVNAGIEESAGELIALLNSDAEADARWVSELAGAAAAYPEYGLFATKMLFYKDRNTIDTFGDGFSTAGFGYKRGWGEYSEAYKEEDEVFGACGGAAAYRRAVLMDIKVAGECFDPDFFAFAEDLDVSLRARLRGHRCMAVPGAVVYHRVRGAWGRRSERAVFLSHRNFILCVMKCFPKGVIIRNILSIAGYNLLAAAADLIKNRRFLYFKSYIAAFGMWRVMKPKRAAIQSTVRITPVEFQRLLTKRWFSVWLRLNRMNRAISERGL